MKSKNIIFSFLFTLFLLTSVSALSWDNKLTEKEVTFDGKSISGNNLLEKYKPIEIKNSFGFGETLFEGYLSQHTEFCGVNCSSTIEINLLEDGPLIEEVIFKDLDGNDVLINGYQFYIIKNGNKIPYELNQKVKAGIYQVFLEGKKNLGESVDWIIKSQGQWINLWADWQDVEWYELDNFNDAPDEVNLWTKNGGAVSCTGDYALNFNLGALGGTTYAHFTANKAQAVDFNKNGNIYTKIDKYSASGGDVIGGFDLGLIDESSNTVYFYTEWGESVYETSKVVKASVDPLNDIITYSVDGGSQNNVSVSSLSNSDEWHYQFRIGESNANVYIWVDYVNYSTGGDMSLKYPTNTTYEFDSLDINYTVVGGTGDSCWYSFDNGITNSSRQDWGLNWSGVSVSEGSNTLNVYCNNTMGVSLRSNIIFTVDTVYPIADITFPLNVMDYSSVGKNETLNWTVGDIHLDACWYDYNNTNTTVTCNDNSTEFVLVEGWNNITFWANDTVGHSNSSFLEWVYNVFQNSVIYDPSTYETASEIFSINLIANSSLTDVNLIHNGVSHDTTLSGGLYNVTFDIPNSVGNKTFYWDFTYAGIHINSTIYYQYVNNTILGICDASLNLTAPYINFTFVDEETLNSINATIDSSTWTYYLGSGTVTKSLIFSNTTANDNYAFCFSASNSTMHNTRSIQYSSPGYPQRKYDASSDLTNATTNKILYLLSSTDGIYTTMQVLDTNSNQLTGVEVTVERRFTFVKEGCTGITITIRPTQTQYTQQLSCGVTSDYTATIEGIKYSRSPYSGIIQPGGHNFTYYLLSSKDNIINASFYIINASSQTVLNSSMSACTPSGCLLFFTYNISAGENIKGRYYVDVGNGSMLLEGDAWWRSIEIPTAGKAGIGTLFYDIIYVFQEWGGNSDTADFNRIVFIFFFMCICISILNYNFQMDTMNPGMFLSILTFFIIMGSIIGGTNPTAGVHGLFYYNNLTTNHFINNYLLAFICVLISFSSFINVNRQAQR